MKKSRKRSAENAATFSVRDKLMAFGIPGAVFVLVVGIFVYGNIQKHDMALDEKLLRWSQLYHLNEQQVSSIRHIELRFHGNGNPFTVGGRHSPAEIHEHHLSISRVMSPADGRRFLDAMERSGGHH